MLTVRQRANDKWQAIVRVKRAGVIVHSESRTFATEALARSWGERVNSQIDRVGHSTRKRMSVTLETLLDDYRKARNEVKPMGRAMLGDIDMLISHMGRVPVANLTAAAWAEFARKRARDGAGPATVKHNLAIARTVLNSAKAMFGLDVDGSSVAEAIKSLELTGHVSNSKRRERRPAADELDKLQAEFKRVEQYPQTQIPMSAIVPLAIVMPRRLGELCSMLWLDYDTAGILTLRDTKHPRVPRTERIPVPPLARRVIDALPRIDERILPYKPESVSAAFDRVCERLKIDDLRFHDLRHEGICRLFEFGLGIQEVALISGHTSWTTLRRYTHLTPQHVLEKLDAGSQAIQERNTESKEPAAGN